MSKPKYFPKTGLVTVFPLVAPATDRDVCVCRSSACINMQNINQSINQKRILINFQLVHMMKTKGAVSSELFLGRTWAKFGRSAPDSVGLVGNGRAPFLFLHFSKKNLQKYIFGFRFYSVIPLPPSRGAAGGLPPGRWTVGTYT